MIPSQKRLEQAFPGKGRALRRLLDGQDDPMQYESVQKWVASCYHTPRRQEQIEVAVNEVLGGYGAEAIFESRVTVPDLVYINLGETYATTLLYDYRAGRWSIGAWGDWVERHGNN